MGPAPLLRRRARGRARPSPHPERRARLAGSRAPRPRGGARRAAASGPRAGGGRAARAHGGRAAQRGGGGGERARRLPGRRPLRAVLAGCRGDGCARVRAPDDARLRLARLPGPLPLEHRREPARDREHGRAHGPRGRDGTPPESPGVAGPRRRSAPGGARAAAPRAWVPAAGPRAARGIAGRVHTALLLRHADARRDALARADRVRRGGPRAARLGLPVRHGRPAPGGRRARARAACRGRARDPQRQRGKDSEPMTHTADIVVAGAGHNSLITAAYLARAGYECLVLDARPISGGGAATEELLGPGYRIDSCSTGHTIIRVNPLLVDDELGLHADYGLEYLEPDPVGHVAFPDGEQLTMWLDLDRTYEEIARFSERHAAGLRPVARGAAARPPARAHLAATERDLGVGRDQARVQRPPRPGVHGLAGVPDARPGRRRGVGRQRLLDHLRTAGSKLVDSARRLGSADRRAHALPRGPRLDGARGQAGLAARHRERTLRRRGDGRRRALHGRPRRALDDSRQAAA